MRKALLVGIDHYTYVSRLYGCVSDAYEVKAMLDRDGDGSVNFNTRIETCSASDQSISRHELKELIRQLFSGDTEIALLYFAGHGYVETTGGYLCATDCQSGDDGVALSEVMTLANQSNARNKVILLDSCHSGVAATHASNATMAELTDGMTILTASTKEQYASEEEGSGVFTTLLVDALGGAAANLLGDITPGSVYAHIDQSLGSWAQRPVFKTNVQTFVSLRNVDPALSLAELQRISEFFPQPGFEFPLDPAYEPERAEGDDSKPDYVPPDPAKNAIFNILQNYNRVGLLIPVGVKHMWHAAMQSKSCKLTALGEHYRRLAERELI